MDKEVLVKRIAEYKAMEEQALLNYHRIQGARIALEQVVKEMSTPEPETKPEG